MSIRQQRLQFLKALKEGIVHINFTKADGTTRIMKATRSPKLGAYAEINSKASVETALNTGRAEVLDLEKSAMRSFNFSRLTSYRLDGETTEIPYVEEATTEDTPERLPSKTGKEMGVAQLIDILNEKVVRIAFTKVDGTPRTMFATRNSDLIDKHMDISSKRKESSESMNSEEKIKAQIAKDYVTVFDLQTRAFKMFKPSNFQEFDVATGVGNWIEFEPKDDAWFLVMRGEKTIKSVFNRGKFKAKNVGEGVSHERILLENKNAAYKKIQENQSQLLKGDEEERLKASTEKVKALCKVMKDKYTSYDLAVFEKLKETAEGIKGKFDRQESIGQEKSHSILSEVKVSEPNKTVTLVYNWGKDVFIFHPRFVINAVSHKVHIDRTEKLAQVLLEPRRTKMSAAMVEDIKSLMKYVAKRRKKGAENLKLNEADVDRLKRYALLVNNHQDRLHKVGLNAIFTNQGNVQAISYMTEGGAKFFISPLYIYDISGKVKRFVYQRESRSSTLKPIVAFLEKNATALKLTPEQAQLVIKMTVTAFNRRRKMSNGAPVANTAPVKAPAAKGIKTTA